jgi:hypothetical protein
MTLQEQTEALDHFQKQMRTLLVSKGNDYAKADRLSNFKNSAAVVGLTPEKVILTELAKKVIRLENLEGKSPENETVNDTLIDLANYAFLYFCAVNEKRDESKTKYVIYNERT